MMSLDLFQPRRPERKKMGDLHPPFFALLGLYLCRRWLAGYGRPVSFTRKIIAYQLENRPKLAWFNASNGFPRVKTRGFHVRGLQSATGSSFWATVVGVIKEIRFKQQL